MELFDKEFLKNSQILFVEHTVNSPKSRFGLKWFLPAINKHKNSLIQVVIASFFVQLLGLFNPLLIQQIIDAVISQGNLKSLNVLGSLLIAMAIAQAFIDLYEHIYSQIQLIGWIFPWELLLFIIYLDSLLAISPKDQWGG